MLEIKGILSNPILDDGLKASLIKAAIEHYQKSGTTLSSN